MAFTAKDITNTGTDGLSVASRDMTSLSSTYTQSTYIQTASSQRPSAYRDVLKRVLDVVLVMLFVPFWLPLVVVCAALVVLDGHNPFYFQKRIGRNGDVFRLWKLRSMVPDAEARLQAHLDVDPAARKEWNATQKLKNDPRVTPIGRVLRKVSLDELPQLFNVLSGDMSLVGPRPMMVDQKTLYPGERYFEMRPGLTGLWQVSERNHCSFAERARFDNTYHRIMSFGTDSLILLRTIGVVLRGTGY
jgi:exopolysaccharide production protein ExoY